VTSVAPRLDDDDAPPQSGVRVIVPARYAGEAERPTDVAAEVAEEVFFDVLELWSAVSPLQGAWFELGLGAIGRAALTVTCWEQPDGRTLRSRWQELLPGYVALDALANLMVDRICR
jgi:hypothetical protein